MRAKFFTPHMNISNKQNFQKYYLNPKHCVPNYTKNVQNLKGADF